MNIEFLFYLNIMYSSPHSTEREANNKYDLQSIYIYIYLCRFVIIKRVQKIKLQIKEKTMLLGITNRLFIIF